MAADIPIGAMMSASNQRGGRYGGQERRSSPPNDDGNGIYGNGGWLGNLPMWARAITVLGATGVICLIAGYVVWVGAQTLPAIQKEQIILNQQHSQIMELYQHQNNEFERQRRVMENVCANIAKLLKDDSREQQCYSH